MSLWMRSQLSWLGVLCLLAAGCTTLPELTDKPISKALPKPSAGPLVVACEALAEDRDRTHSSALLLEENHEALMWRLALIDSAQSSIDIQLYLWHAGVSSTLLFDRLLAAADRGVRVRLLVDDFAFTGDERVIAALSRTHPHFEIRVFNPKKWRGNAVSEGAGFATRFKKLNRRMHNKTWTADQSMSIVGGRNVADQYFGLSTKYNFLDLDVLVAGPVVEEISEGFDEYWNSSGAYPGSMMSRRGSIEDVLQLRARVEKELEERRDQLSSHPIETRDWSKELATLRGTMAQGTVQFLQDRAEVDEDDRHVVTTLQNVTINEHQQVILVTPYLIPTKEGLENLRQSIADGNPVKILVPALAANNQPLVHGHYRKHRKAILQTGAELYEMRPQVSSNILTQVDVPPVTAERTCLHGKAVVGDRDRSFVGSLNLDPRAMEINTECGVLIDSLEFTRELTAFVKTLTTPDNSWQVTLDDKGRLTWSSAEEVRTKEPKASFRSKSLSTMSGLLPIRSQL